MNHNHGKTGSNAGVNETIIKRALSLGGAVPSREIGSTSCCWNAIGTQKRPDRILILRLNCRCLLLRIVAGKKVGPFQYFNHDMEMAISKDVKSLNSNELNILSAKFGSTESGTEQRFFLCVCLSWSHQMRSQQNA